MARLGKQVKEIFRANGVMSISAISDALRKRVRQELGKRLSERHYKLIKQVIELLSGYTITTRVYTSNGRKDKEPLLALSEDLPRLGAAGVNGKKVVSLQLRDLE